MSYRGPRATELTRTLAMRRTSHSVLGALRAPHARRAVLTMRRPRSRQSLRRGGNSGGPPCKRQPNQPWQQRWQIRPLHSQWSVPLQWNLQNRSRGRQWADVLGCQVPRISLGTAFSRSSAVQQQHAEASACKLSAQHTPMIPAPMTATSPALPAAFARASAMFTILFQ